MNIDEVNSLDEKKFIEIFSNVVESYPEAASKVYSRKPFSNVEKMCENFTEHLRSLTVEEKLKILRLHPILAGKQADKGELTKESTEEQRAANLNVLNKETKEEFNNLNTLYLEKFRFPFVICARENKATSISEQLKRRLQNTMEDEIHTGIEEVTKICRLRILNIVTD